MVLLAKGRYLRLERVNLPNCHMLLIIINFGKSSFKMEYVLYTVIMIVHQVSNLSPTQFIISKNESIHQNSGPTRLKWKS